MKYDFRVLGSTAAANVAVVVGLLVSGTDDGC